MSLRLRRGPTSDFTLSGGATRRFDIGEPVFDSEAGLLYVGRGEDTDPTTVGSGGGGSVLGDIFRVNPDTLTVNVTIAANTGASATGPITVMPPAVLTVFGTLVML